MNHYIAIVISRTYGLFYIHDNSCRAKWSSHLCI